MKALERWYSPRLQRDLSLVRWGYMGAPVLIFPTAGGDAEEIERHQVVDTLGPLIHEGRLKVYSCDSLAGRAVLEGEGSPRHRMWLLDQFQQCVYHEVVPAIRADCRSQEIGIVTAGASIGAFNALAVLCRYPDAFTRTVCMSGTYDLTSLLGGEFSEELYLASPLHYLGNLEGPALDRLRARFVLLTSGEGEWEDIGESWRMADVLGRKGIPNRVESWGTEWPHEWHTWRQMLWTYREDLMAP